MKVKVKGGYKIRSHKTGKLYPKVYRTEAAADRRIQQMKSFGESKSEKKSSPRRRKR